MKKALLLLASTLFPLQFSLAAINTEQDTEYYKPSIEIPDESSYGRSQTRDSYYYNNYQENHRRASDPSFKYKNFPTIKQGKYQSKNIIGLMSGAITSYRLNHSNNLGYDKEPVRQGLDNAMNNQNISHKGSGSMYGIYFAHQFPNIYRIEGEYFMHNLTQKFTAGSNNTISISSAKNPGTDYAMKELTLTTRVHNFMVNGATNIQFGKSKFYLHTGVGAGISIYRTIMTSQDNQDLNTEYRSSRQMISPTIQWFAGVMWEFKPRLFLDLKLRDMYMGKPEYYLDGSPKKASGLDDGMSQNSKARNRTMNVRSIDLGMHFVF